MRKTYLVVLSVLVFSALVAASSIPTDPTGGLRPGTYYTVEPFDITGSTVPPFNPFTASFCEQNVNFSLNGVNYQGPDCIFNNEREDTITDFNLAFTNQVGAINCFNTAAGGTAINEFCTHSPNNIDFNSLTIPPGDGDDWESSLFNVLFAGMVVTNPNPPPPTILIDTWSQNTLAAAGINGATPPSVPEPESAYLLLGGISCLFGLMRIRRHLKT